MILHAMIVDDEEDVLESLVPAFVKELATRLSANAAFQEANRKAGSPFPTARLNIKVSASGYESGKVAKYAFHRPVHLHLHLCCEKGGSFRHALRLLREQFFAVVVSDLRFSEDTLGSRAGRFFIQDVIRRNPDTYGILYSAYQKPEDFPADRFVRKGSAGNLAGQELLEKIVEGFVHYLSSPSIAGLCQELTERGLVYQSDAFGAMLRQAYDFAQLYFNVDEGQPSTRRRPRPTILIDGETGTGKTELAGLMHSLSERRAEPFIAATCGQLSDEQFLRSTLFGHIKGSFSGATQDRAGLVETAGRGVLLLDDLHKLGEGSSVILHSFLDDGEYSHLGQDEQRRAARCAIVGTVETPRWEEIKSKGELPESFLHRVEQLVLRVPALAARPEDIEHQARYYCRLHAAALGEEMELTDAATAWLVDFGFPGGNSRKLRDFLKGVLGRCARVTDTIDVADLEEYALESRLSMRPGNVLVRPESQGVSPPPPASAAAASTETWEALSDASSWQGRIARLAARSVADELKLSSEQAEQLCRPLFEQDFPKLWTSLESLASRWSAESRGKDKSIDIKLFDELLRYFVVYRTGSPAKAARELGMKDNALREFIYSREQKREVGNGG